MTRAELLPPPRHHMGLLFAGIAAAMTTLGGCSVGPQRPPMPDMSRLVAVNVQLPEELQRGSERREAPAQNRPVDIDASGFKLGLTAPPAVDTALSPDLLRPEKSSGPRLALYDGIDASHEAAMADQNQRNTNPAVEGLSADNHETKESGVAPVRERDAAIASAAEVWSRRELAAATGEREPVLTEPVDRWSMSQGDMLSEGLRSWADQAGWELVWTSRVDYRIASRLGFSGTLESAVEHLILLYSHSEKPLYADISPRQRLVVVSDDPRELGE